MGIGHTIVEGVKFSGENIREFFAVRSSASSATGPTIQQGDEPAPARRPKQQQFSRAVILAFALRSGRTLPVAAPAKPKRLLARLLPPADSSFGASTCGPRTTELVRLRRSSVRGTDRALRVGGEGGSNKASIRIWRSLSCLARTPSPCFDHLSPTIETDSAVP